VNAKQLVEVLVMDCSVLMRIVVSQDQLDPVVRYWEDVVGKMV
jgi:hypothetical protein